VEDKCLLWRKNLQNSLGPFVYVIQILTFSISFNRSPRKTLWSLLANNLILLWEFWGFHSCVAKKSIFLLFQKSSLEFLTTSRLKKKTPNEVLCEVTNSYPVRSVSYLNITKGTVIFFYHGVTAPSGPGPLHYRGFTIILRHTTIGRIPLDEWSARRGPTHSTTRVTTYTCYMYCCHNTGNDL